MASSKRKTKTTAAGSPRKFKRDKLSLSVNMTQDDLANLGKRIGSGVYRTAYRISDDLVVKIAHDMDDDDHLCSKNEVDLYKVLPKADKPYFARPFIWANDYSWVVYEYIPDVDTGLSNLDAVLDMKRKHHVSDVHDENVGMRPDGTPCIIDYGGSPDGFCT